MRKKVVIIIEPNLEYRENLLETASLLKDTEGFEATTPAEILSLLKKGKVLKVIFDPRDSLRGFNLDLFRHMSDICNGEIILHTSAAAHELLKAGFPRNTQYVQKPLCPFGIPENLN